MTISDIRKELKVITNRVNKLDFKRPKITTHPEYLTITEANKLRKANKLKSDAGDWLVVYITGK